MAKTSILTILIQLAKTGNADKETIKGLASLKANVGQAMGAFAAFAGVAYTVDKALDATVGVMVNYAAQVRTMNRLTGAGSEETSRLIQMADDLTISYESLQKSLWFASKNGVEVNVESLAALADQYVALNSPMEQADFLAKKFGKSGAEMAKMLEQGGDAVKEWANSIEGSLVLTDQAVQEAREYEQGLDELNDQVLAAKVNIGGQLVPALNDMLYSINNNKAVAEEMQHLMKTGQALNVTEAQQLAIINLRIQEYTGGLDSAGVSYRAWAEAMSRGNEELAGQAVSIDEIDKQNTDMLSLIMNLQSENDNYTESMTGLTDKMRDLRDEQSQYLEGSKQYNEMQAEIDETGAAITQLAAEHEMAGKRIAFSLLQQKMAVDGLTDAEFSSLLQIGEAWGIVDAKTVQAAQHMNQQAVLLANGGLNAVKGRMKEINDRAAKLSELSGSTFDFFVNITTRGSFPKGLNIIGTDNNRPDIVTNVGDQTFYAEGGQLGKGWAVVGEQGFEIISPSGYVFPHEVSKQMMVGGIMPDKEFAAGGDLKFSHLPAGETSLATFAPGAGTWSKTNQKRRRDRGELSGGNSEAVASAVVSEAVTPLVESTAQAALFTQTVQQAVLTEQQATRDEITRGNTITEQLVDAIHRMNATNQHTVISAVEQMRG